MKALAFLIGLLIAAGGSVGIVVPSALVWVARQFLASGMYAFSVIGAIRIAFGLILVSAASLSRAPAVLRVLGFGVVIVGLVTVVTGLVANEPARKVLDWWVEQGPLAIRLTALPILVLGCFVTWACAPSRRAG